MRTLKRRESTIKHLKPSTSTGAMGSVTVSWTGTPATIQADVQPMTSSAFRAEYGERADRLMLAIVPNGTYFIGDGVWLDGENTSTPPWIVTSVSAWNGLTNLVIEKRA